MRQAVPGPEQTRNVFALQRTIGNAAVRGILQREAGTLQRDEGEGDKKLPSKTLYVGMNPGAKLEEKTLKNVLKDEVISAMNDPSLEKSLKTDAGIAAWLKAEMPELLANPMLLFFAYTTLQETNPDARDQLAQVFKMFSAAEQGLFSVERLVLSGHSNGVELWGDAASNFNPGGFMLDTTLSRLVGLFPKAAAQVEDVMFSACYTVSSIELVIKVFPNVQTVWAYAGASPAAGAGAEAHISKWESETRGKQTLEAKDGRGKAALWTRSAAESSKEKRGYIRNDPAKADIKQILQSFYGFSVDAVS